MLRNTVIVLCGALVVGLSMPATAGGPASRGDADQLAAQVQVLPRYHQWTLVEPAERAALRAVAGIEAARRDRLVRQGDGVQRGIGIFVADQQGEVEALLAYADLLADTEATLPYALPVATPDEYAVGPQTVGEYLTAAYLEWFGVDVDGSPARFKALFADVADPQDLVQPWIVRLRRVADNRVRTAELKSRIAELPQRVRWAVVTLAHKDSLYSTAEARAVLGGLSASTRQLILNGGNPLPTEPLLRVNDGAFARVLLGDARTLLEARR